MNAVLHVDGQTYTLVNSDLTADTVDGIISIAGPKLFTLTNKDGNVTTIAIPAHTPYHIVLNP